MPNREVIEKWVTALESGDYEQTQGWLHKQYPSGNEAYCCLGVLCDLAVREGAIDPPDGRPVYSSIEYLYDEQGLSLPRSVQEWAGFHEEDPYVHFITEKWDDVELEIVPDTVEDTLAAANDSYGKSFSDIAQIIRENFLNEED